MVAGNFASRTVGPMALSTGIAGILAVVFIVLFFTIGGLFGTLTDFAFLCFVHTLCVFRSE